MFNISRLRTLTALAAAVATCGTALPAMAKSDSGAQEQVRITVESKNGQTFYCVDNKAVTGSRIPKRNCQSRAEWARDGLIIPQEERAADSAKQKPAG